MRAPLLSPPPRFGRWPAWARSASAVLIICAAAEAHAERPFATPFVPLGQSGIGTVEIADITGDGCPDIVYGSSESRNYGERYFGVGSFLGPSREAVFANGAGGLGFEGESGGGLTIGDLNGDGRVDSRDLVAFLDEFGRGDVSADLNGDGRTDALDLQVFLRLYAQEQDR